MRYTLASKIMRFRKAHPRVPIGPLVRCAARTLGRKGGHASWMCARRRAAMAWATRYRWWLDLGSTPEQAGYLAGRGL